MGRSDTVKAILVLEMPSSCSECPCCYVPRCEVNEKTLKTSEIYQCKPDWCPLKPMPSKKEKPTKSESVACFNIGYNACIDEILGDKE